jgi:hypothetical protein
MGHEQLPLNQVHVGLDAAKTMIEGIEQWPRVLVIIVGVGAEQWLGVLRECFCGEQLAAGQGADAQNDHSAAKPRTRIEDGEWSLVFRFHYVSRTHAMASAGNAIGIMQEVAPNRVLYCIRRRNIPGVLTPFRIRILDLWFRSYRFSIAYILEGPCISSRAKAMLGPRGEGAQHGKLR